MTVCLLMIYNLQINKKTSTIHCVSSIFETANHYVSSAGAAHVCMLDASKAFDRVNLLTLFRKLHNRSMCPLFLRFLIHSYCNQKMRVKWNGSLSGTFSASNGVKQGGVLSPFLFTVYLDQLILAPTLLLHIICFLMHQKLNVSILMMLAHNRRTPLSSWVDQLNM